MSTALLRVVSTGLFFLFIFLSGIRLSRSGRPLNGVVLTIHKLVALAAAVFLVVTIYQMNQVATLRASEFTASVVTGLLLVGTVIPGGLLSTDKPMPAAISRMHQIMPFLTVLSTAGSLYLLFW